MPDLKTKLDVIERVPVPDVWDRVEARAQFLPSGGGELPLPASPARRRLAAAVVAFAVFAAAVALALGAFYRPANVAGGPPIDPGEVTFTFAVSQPVSMSVNGEGVPGEMGSPTLDNGYPVSGLTYQFYPDRIPEAAPGALVVVQGAYEATGWIDACCEYGPKPPRHLYELDLAGSASLPAEPGTYFVELSVTVLWGGDGQGGPGEPFTYLFPVRVVAPERSS